MNVFYALSDLNDWVSLAAKLQIKLHWTPIYWVTTSTLIPTLQTHFSDLIIDDFKKVNRGELPAFPKTKATMIDETILNQYSHYEKNILDMMRRLDPDGRSFSYDERLTLYYQHLQYALYLFDLYKPDKIVFNESPHSPFTYILYAIAMEQNIDIIRFSPTHINALVLVSGSIEETSEYFKSHYQKNRKNTSQNLNHDIAAYIARLKGDYADALPSYMLPILNRPSFLSQLLLNAKKAYKFLLKPPELYFYTQNPLFHSKLRGLWFIYNKLKGDLYKKALKKSYLKHTSKVDLKSNFIYIPLHYQPEKTTNPEGGVFHDQYLMVLLLSQAIPSDWSLYVKEHPSQFSPRLEGERGRHINFYQKLSELSNVHLVPLEVASFDLIDTAKATAVVTGTAALESIIRNKYALIFGHVWFQDCEGILMCKTKEDVTDALKTIIDTSIKQKNITAFFKTLQDLAHPAYLNPGNKAYTSVTPEHNVKHLLALIEYHEKSHHVPTL